MPVKNLIGKEGEGFKIAMKGLDGGRVNIAACSLGSAQKCLDLVKEYTQGRKQFGQPLANFQVHMGRISVSYHAGCPIWIRRYGDCYSRFTTYGTRAIGCLID